MSNYCSFVIDFSLEINKPAMKLIVMNVIEYVELLLCKSIYN